MFYGIKKNPPDVWDVGVLTEFDEKAMMFAGSHGGVKASTKNDK